MKKLLCIFYALLLVFALTGCKDKYSTIYCDFDAGDFKSEGYYYLRTVDEVKKFKVDYNASAEMSKKLSYDENFFNNKFVIVLILPESSKDVSFSIESINYKTSTLDIVIKKNTDKKPEVVPGDGTDNNNGKGGTIMDKAESIIDNIGDSLTDNNNNNSNNNGTGNGTPDNNPTMPDDNAGDNNNPTIPDDNSGNNNTPETPNNLINKAYIFEFKKSDTVVKINYKIV